METSETKSRTKPRLGIGSCLAGNAVRYDGQAKTANKHVQTLCKKFDTQPFCPEMGIGLGSPRPPIQLVGKPEQIRVVDVKTGTQDYTVAIAEYASKVLSSAPDICGYILVEGSPSCGYDRVKRFDAKGCLAGRDARGIFAAALAQLNPLLPLEDDERLNDPVLRENFVTRAYAYHDWQALQVLGLTPARLIDFYSRYKTTVMAHHPPSDKRLGSMLASIEKEGLRCVAEEFIGVFMAALTQRETPASGRP